MEKIYAQSLLYDFYGELLTEHQRRVYEEVVFDDLSLGEVAEELGISRQGVHDMVRRTEKALRKYEEKLGLVRKFISLKRKVNEIKETAECFQDAPRQGNSDGERCPRGHEGSQDGSP